LELEGRLNAARNYIVQIAENINDGMALAGVGTVLVGVK
jgi:hypothetical protein